MPEKVHVTCMWRSEHTLEVPEGQDTREFAESIANMTAPDSILDQLTTQGAELYDWEVNMK
jgi:hypothetical protein